MKIDRIRNYKQMPNFGAIEIPEKIFKKYSGHIGQSVGLSIELLKGKLPVPGILHAPYIFYSADNKTFYFPTIKGSKVEEFFISFINNIEKRGVTIKDAFAGSSEAIKSVDDEIAQAAIPASSRDKMTEIKDMLSELETVVDFD